MIHVIQNDQIYEIIFPYDPGVIELIKQVPGRRWVPESKKWTIDKDKLGFLINQFRGTPYESSLKIVSDEALNVNATVDKTTQIPDIDISDVDFKVKDGAAPYKHQLDFMKFAKYRQDLGNYNGFLIADEMGAGKTLELANLAIYNRKRYGYKHCLVVCCVNSSKYNWKNDIESHLKEPAYILGTRYKRNGDLKFDTGSKEKIEDLSHRGIYNRKTKTVSPFPYFIIMNIEGFRYREGKRFPIADLIQRYIDMGEISMIAIDEVHKNMSMSSLQGKAIQDIHSKATKRAMWLPMTGTPVVNKPTDLYLPLKLIGGHNFKNFYSWCQRYCVYGGYGDKEIIGYKNISELKNLLQPNMIRRLKMDILDLPPKIQYTEYVENTAYQSRLYDKISQEMINKKAEILSSLNPTVAFMRLRQVNGSPELIDNTLSTSSDEYIKYNAKLKRLLELLEDAKDRGEKTIVFSNWVEPLRTLYKFVSARYKTCCFTGTMKSDERERHKQVFQTNPEYTVLLGTIGAAGTTHTFTAATNVIFYDEPWTPSDKVQAEDRAHRIGTKSSVNIFTLISKDTVDDKVHDILYQKSSTSKFIVDNKIDLRNNPELFDMMLS